MEYGKSTTEMLLNCLDKCTMLNRKNICDLTDKNIVIGRITFLFSGDFT